MYGEGDQKEPPRQGEGESNGGFQGCWIAHPALSMHGEAARRSRDGGVFPDVLGSNTPRFKRTAPERRQGKAPPLLACGQEYLPTQMGRQGRTPRAGRGRLIKSPR